MARSYKKNPCWGRHNSKKGSKRLTNRKVRRAKDVSNGNHYRRFYSDWDAFTRPWFQTWNEYWLGELSDWKRRNEGRWGGISTRGYCANYRYLNKKDHWTHQNPELHKEKHYAYWKKRFVCK